MMPAAAVSATVMAATARVATVLRAGALRGRRVLVMMRCPDHWWPVGGRGRSVALASYPAAW